MKRGISRAALAIVIVIVVAQVIPVSRTNPPVTSDLTAPPDVKVLVRHACYNCHSNETVWPWYSRIAPVSWLVAHDVDEGREQMNFSTWTALTPAKQLKKLKKVVKELRDEDMPPWYYLLMHPEARLSTQQRDTIEAWAGAKRAGQGQENLP